MQEKPIRPVIEDDDEPKAATAELAPSREDASTLSPMIRNLVVVLLLVAVAVAGFASSAGWFNFADEQLTDSQLPTDAVVAPPPSNSADNNTAISSNQQTAALLEDIPKLGPLLPTDGVAIAAEASRVIEHLQSVLPQSLEAREVKARFEFEFGKIETAQRIWETLLEQEPQFVYALRGLGDICTIEGNLEEAVRYFRRAVLADPENLSRQLTLGAAMLQAGQIDESEEVLLSLLAKNDSIALAHAELGRVYLQKKDFKSAAEQFQVALAGDETNAQTHLGLATALARLGQRAEAKVHQERHIVLRDQDRRQLESGRRDYDDAEAMRIDVGNVYVNIARVYMANGYTAAAEIVLLRAARMNDSNLEARQALSFLSGQKGKPFDALRWMKEVAELEPHEFSYSEEVARLYMGLQQIDESEKTLLAFLEDNPDNLRALRSSARFYVEAKPNADKAVQYAERAAELDPSAVGHATLASTYERVGRLADAAKAMQQAALLEPSNTVYAQTAALLKEQIAASGTLDTP